MSARPGKHPSNSVQGLAEAGVLPPRARPQLPSVAVLPFRDERAGPPETHLSEGLAEEVLQGLKQAEGLRALSRTTSFPLAGSGLPVAVLGRRLKAHAVLDGVLRSRGGRLTLEVRLVEVASGRHLVEATHDFEQGDLFAVLESVISEVAAALQAKALPRIRPPVDLEAFGSYLRGRQAYYQYSRQGMVQAAAHFRAALDLDPGYAAAWAMLANCAAYSYIYLDRTETQRELAETCSRRALELDPDLAEAHASRGVALSAAGQAEEAEAAFETALRLDPNLYEAAYFYARHCFAADKPERAIEYFEWAAELRPEDFQAILLVAQVYHSLGVEDEAEAARRQGLALVEARLARDPDDVRARYLGANALVALGEREKGLAWARMARELDPDDPMLLYNLGCIHALAGDPTEAMDCLERAAAGGLSQRNWLLHDGDLDSIRDEPRFQSLVASMED